MHIRFSEEAVRHITQELSRGGNGWVKLVYDSEGCGCAVSGVPTFWLVDEPGSHDLVVQETPFRVCLDRKHEVFFEEHMSADYKASELSFVLKSSGQIYNARMKLVDRRTARVE
ncbi:hypothetical protein PAESOLCIP111_06545 [Paenibacillus solanacearum]|uniref:Core domain-containing protein n=1 Tax=Paenibacillus solanacearum TaxID=2048548 RepID=A0A916KAZ2_9BACL|nr:iron-sulfur cluster biosynthesis family protein [Paenibacillus solanacearum]CAG7652482.1 hypothetical protein PAESOLCIP111_06545 [Paenibacillus solanacearum]